MLLVDVSKKIGDSTKLILKNLQEQKTKNVHLVLNKIDKIKRDKLLAVSAEINEYCDFQATYMVSAVKADGVQDLLAGLAKNMPEGPWHYPEDHLTDMPMRLMAAEITREKLFQLLHQELPYNLTVETESWEDFNDGSLKIDQTVFVTRDTHKKIILGKGGSMIKKVGQRAREELEEILEQRVHLKLFVKVQEDWLDKDEHYEIWGLNPKA